MPDLTLSGAMDNFLSQATPSLPATAISGQLLASSLPDTLVLDYVTLAETAEAILPQGTLTRVGDELRMVNSLGIAEPVAQNNAAMQENIVPYRRVSGTKMLIPFGGTGYVGKTAPNGTVHYVEIARVKIPAEDVYDGQTLTLKYTTSLKMPTGVSSQSFWRTGLIPSQLWDLVSVPQVGTYFNSASTAQTNGHLINGVGANEHNVIHQIKTVPITFNATDGFITFGTATIVTNVGYQFAPTPGAQTVTAQPTTGTSQPFVPYTELELVWFANALTDTTKYAILEYTLEADMAPPKPAAPSNLIGSIASPTSVQLNWTDNSSNETGFEIWRTAFEGARYAVKVGEVGPGITSYVDGGYPFSAISSPSTPRTTGYYRVRAINGRTPSEFTNEVSVTPA
jgi:hypothetical protein